MKYSNLSFFIKKYLIYIRYLLLTITFAKPYMQAAQLVDEEHSSQLFMGTKQNSHKPLLS